MQNSIARAVSGAAVLIIVAAVAALVATKWDNLFPPTDYEDCAVRAAKGATSKDSLLVLLSLCDSEFKDRRKAGGEERQVAEQEAQTARKAAEQQAEATHKAEQLAALRASQQRAAAAADSTLQLRKSQTIPAVHVTVNGLICFMPFSDTKCPGNKLGMRVELTNQLKETLSGALIGLAVAPPNGTCPSSYAETHLLHVPLPTGETRVATFNIIDVVFSHHPVCIKVMDVQFGGDAQTIINMMRR